jgi:hypothetical protein
LLVVGCAVPSAAAPSSAAESFRSTQPWLGHWVGTFAYEADETLTATECIVHRIERASGAVDCGPGQDFYVPCRSEGQVRYDHTTEIKGSFAETRMASGEQVGKLSVRLGFIPNIPGYYDFHLFTEVTGTYTGIRGGAPVSGTEIITVNAQVSETRELSREIVFDSDQPAHHTGPLRKFGDTIGSQCFVTAPTGHRHLTVKLTRG